MVPDLRKLTDDELSSLVVELAPSWLVHDHSAERRWVIAEAMNRGIDPESLLRRAIGSTDSPPAREGDGGWSRRRG